MTAVALPPQATVADDVSQLSSAGQLMVASHPAWCLAAALNVGACELFDPDDAPVRWFHCGAERTAPAYGGDEIGLSLVREDLDDGRTATLIDVDKNGKAAFRLTTVQARLLAAELNYLLACQETR